MSTAILRDKSFGNVLKTLQSPSIRNGAHTIDIEGVMNTSNFAIRTSDGFAAFVKAVRLFVQRCIFFNHESYRLRYGEEEVCEPVTEERLDALYSIGEVVSKTQLFMTLSCICYNSGIREHLDVGETYPLQATFNEWHEQLEKLMQSCASAIAWETADKEKCEWF